MITRKLRFQARRMKIKENKMKSKYQKIPNSRKMKIKKILEDSKS